MLQALYEERFQEALRRNVDQFSAKDLAAQRKMVFNVMALEYDGGTLTDLRLSHLTPVKKGMVDMVVRLSAVTPSAVTLDLHMCCGESMRQDSQEPTDSRLVVAIANDIVLSLGEERPIELTRMPFSKSRIDGALFRVLE